MMLASWCDLLQRASELRHRSGDLATREDHPSITGGLGLLADAACRLGPGFPVRVAQVAQDHSVVVARVRSDKRRSPDKGTSRDARTRRDRPGLETPVRESPGPR